jgi:hypothetical protein
LRIGIWLDRYVGMIEEVSGDPGLRVDGEDRAMTTCSLPVAGVITGRWTNDEWGQWVAPVCRRII